MKSFLGRLISACAVVGCGAGPQVKVTAQYRPDALRDTRVLIVPLAVSEELGDQRTGVILSDVARSAASDAACREMAEELGKHTIICLDRQTSARSPALSELERLFALDQPIP